MVMGYALYYVHMLIDHCYLKKHSKCGHNYSCQCKKALLEARGVDRPFLQTPIRGPLKLDGKFVSPSARDEETLIRIGLLISTLISADHDTSPAIPTYMDKYTTSEIRMNNLTCRAYSGRFIRYQAAIKPV